MVRVKFVLLEWVRVEPVEEVTEPLPIVRVTNNGVEAGGIGMLAYFKHHQTRLLKLSDKVVKLDDLTGKDVIIVLGDDFGVGNIIKVFTGGVELIKGYAVAGSGIVYDDAKNDVWFRWVPVEVADDEKGVGISIRLPPDLEVIEERVEEVNDAGKINDVMRFMRKFMDAVFNA